MRTAVKALDSQERYGLYWYQYTLSHSDNSGEGRDMDANPNIRDYDDNLVFSLRTYDVGLSLEFRNVCGG